MLCGSSLPDVSWHTASVVSDDRDTLGDCPSQDSSSTIQLCVSSDSADAKLQCSKTPQFHLAPTDDRSADDIQFLGAVRTTDLCVGAEPAVSGLATCVLPLLIRWIVKVPSSIAATAGSISKSGSSLNGVQDLVTLTTACLQLQYIVSDSTLDQLSVQLPIRRSLLTQALQGLPELYGPVAAQHQQSQIEESIEPSVSRNHGEVTLLYSKVPESPLGYAVCGWGAQDYGYGLHVGGVPLHPHHRYRFSLPAMNAGRDCVLEVRVAPLVVLQLCVPVGANRAQRPFCFPKEVNGPTLSLTESLLAMEMEAEEERGLRPVLTRSQRGGGGSGGGSTHEIPAATTKVEKNKNPSAAGRQKRARTKPKTEEQRRQRTTAVLESARTSTGLSDLLLENSTTTDTLHGGGSASMDATPGTLLVRRRIEQTYNSDTVLSLTGGATAMGGLRNNVVFTTGLSLTRTEERKCESLGLVVNPDLCEAPCARVLVVQKPLVRSVKLLTVLPYLSAMVTHRWVYSVFASRDASVPFADFAYSEPRIPGSIEFANDFSIRSVLAVPCRQRQQLLSAHRFWVHPLTKPQESPNNDLKTVIIASGGVITKSLCRATVAVLPAKKVSGPQWQSMLREHSVPVGAGGGVLRVVPDDIFKCVLQQRPLLVSSVNVPATMVTLKASAEGASQHPVATLCTPGGRRSAKSVTCTTPTPS